MRFFFFHKNFLFFIKKAKFYAILILMKNIIFKTISEHLNENSVFIFPTQMAADLWADKIITESEVSAVSMERFVPWDIFKSESIR